MNCCPFLVQGRCTESVAVGEYLIAVDVGSAVPAGLISRGNVGRLAVLLFYVPAVCLGLRHTADVYLFGA